jgi:predicted nucleic acid-binding Zn ribbon protein
MRWGALSRKVQVTCAVCGTFFYRYPSQVSEGEMFCSKRCCGLRNGERITVQCVICGKEMQRKPSQTWKQNPCCSNECRWQYQRQRVTGEGSPNWKGGKKEYHCAVCGKSIWKYECQIQGRVYCSQSCHGRMNAQTKTGENNPYWKGGERIGYYGPNWREQRSLARERDNHACQRCGVTAEQLGREPDVHHIKPFRTFDYVPGHNNNYLRANDLSNLISLCTSCHKRVEAGTAII